MKRNALADMVFSLDPVDVVGIGLNEIMMDDNDWK